MSKKVFNILGLDIVTLPRPMDNFHTDRYLRLTQRRQEHLATLNLNITSSTVLEVGAGVGDHTSFFLDRGCRVVSSEAREENLKVLAIRYPGIRVLKLDLDNPPKNLNELFDIVYCYGVLYHLNKPIRALEFLSHCCKTMLLIETCVSFGEADVLNVCSENKLDRTQSLSGIGCRPTRGWVYNELKKYFKYVYLPITQPNHEEFPIDWTSPTMHKAGFARAVFIAARQTIDNPLLTESIPMQQKRSS